MQDIAEEQSIFINGCKESLIHGVIFKNMSVTVLLKENQRKIFPEYKIADLLNVISSRVNKKQNNPYKVSSQLEKAIYKKFLDVIWFNREVYLYTGGDFHEEKIKGEILARREVIIKNYISAPKKISLRNECTVIDELNQEWAIGYSKMKFICSSKKINGSSKQSKLNEIICKIAVEVNNSPNFKYARPEDGADAITGRFSEDFEREDRFLFVLKNGIKPSIAVRKLLAKTDEPYIIECVIAIQIIEYLSVLEFLGDNEFDRVFSKIGVVFSRGKRNNAVSTIRVNLSEDGPEKLERKYTILAKNQKKYAERLNPGEVIYIRNIEPYLKRHAFGESNGHNLVYLGKSEKGEPQFAGLFTEKRIRTYREIIEMLVDDYNKQPHYIREENGEIICERAKIGGYC